MAGIAAEGLAARWRTRRVWRTTCLPLRWLVTCCRGGGVLGAMYGSGGGTGAAIGVIGGGAGGGGALEHAASSAKAEATSNG